MKRGSQQREPARVGFEGGGRERKEGRRKKREGGREGDGRSRKVIALS